MPVAVEPVQHAVDTLPLLIEPANIVVEANAFAAEEPGWKESCLRPDAGGIVGVALAGEAAFGLANAVDRIAAGAHFAVAHSPVDSLVRFLRHVFHCPQYMEALQSFATSNVVVEGCLDAD